MFRAGQYDFLRNLIGLKPLTLGSTPVRIVRRQSNNKNGSLKSVNKF